MCCLSGSIAVDLLPMCTLAQPRVFYALAKDGLLPQRFLDTDSSGSPRFATSKVVLARRIVSSKSFSMGWDGAGHHMSHDV